MSSVVIPEENKITAHGKDIDHDALSSHLLDLEMHYTDEYKRFITLRRETNNQKLLNQESFLHGLTVGLKIAQGCSLKEALDEFEADMRKEGVL